MKHNSLNIVQRGKPAEADLLTRIAFSEAAAEDVKDGNGGQNTATDYGALGSTPNVEGSGAGEYSMMMVSRNSTEVGRVLEELGKLAVDPKLQSDVLRRPVVDLVLAQAESAAKNKDLDRAL